MRAHRSDVEYWSAGGGLTLHAEVKGPQNAPRTVLCLHGLTRNSADFSWLADHLALRYRVITTDMRGRGKSQRDPDPANYHPATYVADTWGLLEHLAIPRVVVIGTSMGGLMAMIMGATQPERLLGIVLNDIGPEVPATGLARLSRSLKERAPTPTWAEAAQQARRMNAMAFPDYGDADWDAFARRTYVEDSSGHPVAAFDLAILRGLDGAQPTSVPPDLWSLWPKLKGIPMLALRGALSDIISPDILSAMVAAHPNLKAVTVPNRGHAPMLDEPVAVAAIDAFLAGLA